MADIPTNDPGVAGFSSDTHSNAQYIASDTPAMVTVPMSVAAATDLPIYSVVGLDGSGDLIEAVEGTTDAIGILMAKTGAAAAGRSAPVARVGNFFANWLSWPASYDDEAKKMAAFDGATGPTQIFLTKHPHGPAL